jgi:TolA-binding protein
MTDHLTRKDLKQQDAFTEGVGSAVEYVHGHQRLIAMVFAGALGLGLVVAGALAWMGRQDRQANELLARAIRVFDAPIVATGAKPDDATAPSFKDEAARRAAAKPLFTELAGFGTADAGEVAPLYLAQIAMQEGDTATARKLWQEFLDSHPGHLAAAGVQLTLLDLDRAEGKSEEVATKLRDMVGKPGKALPDDVILYQLATTLDGLGKKEDARQVWQRILDEFPESTYAGQARQATAAARS